MKLCSEFLVQKFRDGSSIECQCSASSKDLSRVLQCLGFSYETTADTLPQRASSGSSKSGEYLSVSSDSSLKIRDQRPVPNRLKPQPRQGHIFDAGLLFDTIYFSEKPDAQVIRAASTWFEHLEKRAYPALNALESQPEDSKIHGIRIAVLDTGIDLDHPSIAKPSIKTRMECKDFTGTQPPDISDKIGHGTHVADTLLKVSPDNIQVFIAKIIDSKHFTEATAGHIADAIEYAVNTWKVDIITMSLGFKGRQPKIEKAIKLAGASDVLIFAAAANHGALDQVAFPARMNGVFAINSTDGLGAKSAFTPRPRNDNDNFSVLGEAVRAAWPLSLIPGGFVYLSGTSHATPVAVGIAALVLEFYKRSVGYEERPIYKRLRSYEGMARVFRRMMVIDRPLDGYTWLCPWTLLQVSEHREPSDIAKAIAHELGSL
ncbi:subtilisin-like protein [Cadophora sp. DSE1049]|nr:subtilisin-like protein [Cadophora sp. DSE1049]